MKTIAYKCRNWTGFEDETFWECDFQGRVVSVVEGNTASGYCPSCDYRFQVDL